MKASEAPFGVNRTESRKRGGAPAFTLAELQVVIGILAVLATLLLPALASSQEVVRSIRCVANLGQWGLAFRMYADENEDYLPRRGQGVQALDRIDRPDDWFNALPPYFNLPPFGVLAANNQAPKAHSQSVFVCPTARRWSVWGWRADVRPKRRPITASCAARSSVA